MIERDCDRPRIDDREIADDPVGRILTDEQHAIARLRSIGKTSVGRPRLDVELAPAQRREMQVAIEPLAVLQQPVLLE